jgi:hypothetical protein
MGPGGILEGSGRVLLKAGRVVVVVADDGTGGAPGARADAQGAAVAPGAAPLAQGALVPAVGSGSEAVVEVEAGCCGPDMVCVVGGGGTAFGSRSQLNREPKGKCWTTGNFESTSALYILIMPCRPESLLEHPILHDDLFERRQTNLVDLAPSRLNTRYVVQHRAVLPEGTPFHVVYEPDGREIHVRRPLALYSLGSSHVSWRRCVR